MNTFEISLKIYERITWMAFVTLYITGGRGGNGLACQKSVLCDEETFGKKRKKKHSGRGSCSKLHSLLNIELPNQDVVGIIPKTKHALLTLVYCQQGWVSLQSLAEMSSPPGPSCGQIWSNTVLRVTLKISVQNFALIFQWKQQKRHNSLFGMQVDQSADNLSYSFIPTRVSPVIDSRSARKWLPKSLLTGFHHQIHCLTCVVFLYLHPNTRYQTLPPWNNCHYIPLSSRYG